MEIISKWIWCYEIKMSLLVLCMQFDCRHLHSVWQKSLVFKSRCGSWQFWFLPFGLKRIDWMPNLKWMMQTHLKGSNFSSVSTKLPDSQMITSTNCLFNSKKMWFACNDLTCQRHQCTESLFDFIIMIDVITDRNELIGPFTNHFKNSSDINLLQ